MSVLTLELEELTVATSVELERLQALKNYNILDTPQESEFDDIVAQAAAICNTPISLISLITEERQWFKASIGLEVKETPRSVSFCHYAIEEEAVLEIPNALMDLRFFKNPLVTGNPNMRFYAGAPLVTPQGHKLGTLCVIDTEPRELSEEQRFALAELAEQVVVQMELRLTN